MNAEHFFESLEARCLLATFTVTNLADSGAGSLRAAIADANGAGGADVVTFDPGVAGTITLASELEVTEDLTINGPGRSTLTLSGAGATRVLRNYPGASLHVTDLTIADGRDALLMFAGGVFAAGPFAATNVDFINNTGDSAGAVFSFDSQTLTSCLFDGNYVLWSGAGAVFSFGGAVITDSVFNDNSAGSFSSAGAVYVDGTLTIESSTFTNNTGESAGAVYFDGQGTITDSTFTGNTGESGGAIFTDSNLTVTDSVISSNTKPVGNVGGGGIMTNGGVLTLIRTTMAQNTSAGRSGAVYVGTNTASVLIEDSEFTGNIADHVGGAISTFVNTTIRGSTFSGNLADSGGAIHFANNGGNLTLTLENSTFSGNAAGLGGGGVYVDPGNTLVVESCTIAGNSAVIEAGGISTQGGPFSLRNTIVAGNTGGDLYALAPITAAGNLIGDASSAGGLVQGVNNNIVGANPLLGALADNGGPTRTRLLLPGSPAIGAGVTPTSLTDDQRGSGFARVRGAAIDIGAVEMNVSPLLTALQRSAPSVTRGDAIVLTATGALDGDGLIASVRFYLDANHDGVADSGELIATDADGSNGFSHTVNGTLGMSLGVLDFLARSVDDEGALSITIATSVSLTNAIPTAGGLTPSAPSITRGQQVTLTLANPADADGTVRVDFFLDANGNGVPDGGELIGSDTDGTDGMTLTFTSTLIMAPGTLAFLARAVDNDGAVSVTRLANVTLPNLTPTASGLTPSASSVARGQGITLTVLNALDADGTVRADFYLDLNGNGVGDVGELIGSDTDDSDGLSLTIASTMGWSVGAKTFLAVIVDNDGARSAAAPASVGVTNVLPSLTGLTPSVLTLAQGDALTLTTTGGADADGAAVVKFYYDANGNGSADADELLGVDSNGSDGFSYALTLQQSAALATGARNFIGVAVDNDGGKSTALTTTTSVLFSIRGGLDRQIVGTADATNASRVAIVNPYRSIIVFEEGWIAANLQALTGAPPTLSDAVIWTDPKDDLVYVAAPTIDGLLLFTRDLEGAWSVRNLSIETGATASPTRGLTTFISINRVVVLAGLTDSGHIVGFKQSGAENPDGGPAFEFVDISADLESQGMATPRFGSLISYVPTWDAWHLAGIDADGRIQSVWINLNVPGFTQWRVDDLTALTGAPAMSSQLAVTLTSWGGINLTGLSADGALLTTWWVPQFGGDWLVNNLTEQFHGARLVAGNVSGYTTSWDGLNYVGIGEDGRVVVYWWAPSLTDWSVTPLLPESAPLEGIPTGKLSSSSSSAGTLNVYGTSAANDVIRMSWQPGGAPSWTAENLSELAERV